MIVSYLSVINLLFDFNIIMRLLQNWPQVLDSSDLDAGYLRKHKNLRKARGLTPSTPNCKWRWKFLGNE